MSVSLVEAEMTVQAPPEPADPHKGCLICTTTRTPQNAYRAHTLDRTCWCALSTDGTRALSNCWLVKVYLPDPFYKPQHP